ncbi:MAG: O-antigen ligase family protein [Patescibacteria group bacterium]
MFESFFIWFLVIFFRKNPKILHKRRFLLSIFAVSLLLIVLNVLMFVLPVEYLYWVPGLNLFRNIVGHNHIAAWLLLINPLILHSFFQLGDYSKTKKRVLASAYFFLAILMILSFGRVANMIFVIQSALLFLINKQSSMFYRTKKHFQFKPYGWFFSITLLLVFLGFLTMVATSLISTFQQKDNCLPGNFDNQLCKRLDHEGRFTYWRQAVGIFGDYPLLGSGPGTYSKIRSFYASKPGAGSGFAHNYYLELLAETGLIGLSSFLFVLGYLTYQSFVVVKKDLKNLNFAFFVAAASGMVNAFFDFDFDFVTIFLTVLLMLVFVANQTKNRRSLLSQLFSKFVLIALGLLIISYALIFAYSELLIRKNRIDFSFVNMPHFLWHEQIYYDYFKDDPKKIKEFFQSYSNNDKNLKLQLELVNTLSEKNYYQEKIYQIDKWYEILNPSFDFYLQNGQIDLSISKAKYFLHTVRQAMKNEKYYLSFSQYQSLYKNILQVADAAYTHSRYGEAGDLYLQVEKDRPWIIISHRPAFIGREVVPEQLSFAQAIQKISPESFGEYRKEYANYLLQVFEANLKAKTIDSKIFSLVDTAEEIEPWNRSGLRRQALSAVNRELQNSPQDPINQELYDEVIVDFSQHGEATVRTWDILERKSLAEKARELSETAIKEGDLVKAQQHYESIRILLPEDAIRLESFDDIAVDRQ